MRSNRFVVNEQGYIIDTLNPTNNPYCRHEREELEDEKCLRERLFKKRLRVLIGKLIVNRRPMEKSPAGHSYQPYNEEAIRICNAIESAVHASHLNTFDPAGSIQRK